MTNLAVGETMEETALVDVGFLEDNISVASAAGGSDNILIERKGDEDDDRKEIDSRADSSHAFRDLALVCLAQVPAHEAGAHEGRAKPSDHGVAQSESQQGQGERRDEGLAIALECVGEHRKGRKCESEEREGLGPGEGGVVRGADGHGGQSAQRRNGGLAKFESRSVRFNEKRTESQWAWRSSLSRGASLPSRPSTVETLKGSESMPSRTMKQ